MVSCRICDNQKIDTESDTFKNKVADAVREFVVRDWDKISNIKKYEEIIGGIIEYHVDVTLFVN